VDGAKRVRTNKQYSLLTKNLPPSRPSVTALQCSTSQQVPTIPIATRDGDRARVRGSGAPCHSGPTAPMAVSCGALCWPGSPMTPTEKQPDRRFPHTTRAGGHRIGAGPSSAPLHGAGGVRLNNRAGEHARSVQQYRLCGQFALVCVVAFGYGWQACDGQFLRGLCRRRRRVAIAQAVDRAHDYLCW
jgi:hypothetical protein